MEDENYLDYCNGLAEKCFPGCYIVKWGRNILEIRREDFVRRLLNSLIKKVDGKRVKRFSKLIGIINGGFDHPHLKPRYSSFEEYKEMIKDYCKQFNQKNVINVISDNYIL